MLNPNELDDNVFSAIANNMGIEGDNQKDIDKIAALSVREAVDRFLGWHGIIGYTDTIINTIDNIRNSEVNYELS
jgi:hypothetical protein